MTAAELTRHLAKRFPVERSVAGLVDVTFMHPVMSVNDAEKSLIATFKMAVRVPLSIRLLNGSMLFPARRTTCRNHAACS